jgi:BlaI family penicillinase repressor
MKITTAETEVIRVLWTRSPQSADELVEAVGVKNGWKQATVRTLIHRLVGKGALVAEREGRGVRYRPLLQRDEWLAEQSASLLDRWFSGRIAPFVAHFAEQGKLTRKDAQAIRNLLDEIDDKS